MEKNSEFPVRGASNPVGIVPVRAVPANDTANENAPAPDPASGPVRGKAFTNPMTAPSKFRIDHARGVWTVVKDGRFAGDYLRESHAKAALAAPPLA